MAEHLEKGRLVVNRVVYAEIAFNFDTIEQVGDLLPAAHYRAAGGGRATILPDFLVGAHAVVERMHLLTRDVRRYRSYFPELKLIAPGERD